MTNWPSCRSNSTVQEMSTVWPASLRPVMKSAVNCLASSSMSADWSTRAESRLPQIKTQREYLAVLKEVDTAKKQIRN